MLRSATGYFLSRPYLETNVAGIRSFIRSLYDIPSRYNNYTINNIIIYSLLNVATIAYNALEKGALIRGNYFVSFQYSKRSMSSYDILWAR